MRRVVVVIMVRRALSLAKLVKVVAAAQAGLGGLDAIHTPRGCAGVHEGRVAQKGDSAGGEHHTTAGSHGGQEKFRSKPCSRKCRSQPAALLRGTDTSSRWD
mmetsp:Transcript_30700/g.78193  ORF Transcript_30700/g.78193 Transcript_30700/m.78193 type:complete len:102 (-) Transcript_30700:57-362(-)